MRAAARLFIGKAGCTFGWGAGHRRAGEEGCTQGRAAVVMVVVAFLDVRKLLQTGVTESPRHNLQSVQWVPPVLLPSPENSPCSPRLPLMAQVQPLCYLPHRPSSMQHSVCITSTSRISSPSLLCPAFLCCASIFLHSPPLLKNLRSQCTTPPMYRFFLRRGLVYTTHSPVCSPPLTRTSLLPPVQPSSTHTHTQCPLLIPLVQPSTAMYTPLRCTEPP